MSASLQKKNRAVCDINRYQVLIREANTTCSYHMSLIRSKGSGEFT